MTFGHVTTQWSALREYDAVTANWVRARQYITKGELWNVCTSCELESVGFVFHNGSLTVRTIMHSGA